MVHAAESPEEVAFLLRGEGPLREVYGRFAKTPWTPPGTTPVRHLHALGVLGPTTLLVHGVQVDEEEVGLLAETGTKVVLCPRSNRNLEVGEAPSPSTPSTGWSSPWARTPGAQAPTWT